MPYALEVTDTFGGEANYCWVRRGKTDSETRRGQFKALREVGGWQGYKLRVLWDSGDTVAVKPDGLLQIGFISYDHNF